MGDLNIHIESLALPPGPPDPDAVAAALAGHLGDRLDPSSLAAVVAAVTEATASPPQSRDRRR